MTACLMTRAVRAMDVSMSSALRLRFVNRWRSGSAEIRHRCLVTVANVGPPPPTHQTCERPCDVGHHDTLPLTTLRVNRERSCTCWSTTMIAGCRTPAYPAYYFNAMHECFFLLLLHEVTAMLCQGQDTEPELELQVFTLRHAKLTSCIQVNDAPVMDCTHCALPK